MHRLKNWHLLAICVLVWSTTWHAITFQLGHVPSEVGVALRFALAGAVVLALCIVRKERLRFTAPDHAMLALQGSLMYGASYVCVYNAELYVFSGLVAVGYSASPLINGLGARALFGIRTTWRFMLGGVLALAGVTLIFWPEFARAEGGRSMMLGTAITVASRNCT